jgi:hypothetical protein
MTIRLNRTPLRISGPFSASVVASKGWGENESVRRLLKKVIVHLEMVK